MPLIYYWRGDNYRRDLDMGAGFHLNQANPLLHEIDLGASLWAFTRAGSGDYFLAAELVIKAKTINPPNFRYGRYRVWGDMKKSRYFRVEGQPRAGQIIRSLSIRANAEILGRSFQGKAAVRKITERYHKILLEAAKDLELEPRARILPEEELEASLLLGDANAVRDIILKEDAGIAEKRRVYLYGQAPVRNRELVRELQKIYQGRCQICLWKPKEIYGTALCHAHHIHWLSRGGDDRIENMVLICPNHHSAIHKCDAPLDYENMSFNFGFLSERIQIRKHKLWI